MYSSEGKGEPGLASRIDSSGDDMQRLTVSSDLEAGIRYSDDLSGHETTLET